MRSTFRVLFYTKNQAIKNGRVPVMGRITVNGTTASFSCKRDVPLALWDAKGNCAKGKSEEARRLNRELENIIAVIIAKRVLNGQENFKNHENKKRLSTNKS